MDKSSAPAQTFHTAVIGTGSSGTAVASCLSRLSECMQFNSKGLIQNNHKHTLISYSGTPCTIECSEFDFSTLDCVFICTKIYQIKTVIDQYIDKIPVSAPIILSCNGFILDILDKLILSYPTHHFRISYVDFGVSKIKDYTYKVNSSDSSFIWGSYSRSDSSEFYHSQVFPFEMKLSNYKDEFTRISFIFSDSCIRHNCNKWIFNTCLNSLCTYHDCRTNGEVLNYSEELKQVFDETFNLSKILFKKYQLQTDSDSLFKGLLSLIERTFLNQNSMVSDILEHRHSENDYLAGMSRQDPQSFPLLSKIYSYISKLDANSN